jgi:hypothetical protein
MQSDEWYEGYSCYERGQHFNPYMHWSFPEDQRLDEEWQLGYDSAKRDYESETYQEGS